MNWPQDPWNQERKIRCIGSHVKIGSTISNGILVMAHCRCRESQRGNDKHDHCCKASGEKLADYEVKVSIVTIALREDLQRNARFELKAWQVETLAHGLDLYKCRCDRCTVNTDGSAVIASTAKRRMTYKEDFKTLKTLFRKFIKLDTDRRVLQAYHSSGWLKRNVMPDGEY